MRAWAKRFGLPVVQEPALVIVGASIHKQQTLPFHGSL